MTRLLTAIILVVSRSTNGDTSSLVVDINTSSANDLLPPRRPDSLTLEATILGVSRRFNLPNVIGSYPRSWNDASVPLRLVPEVVLILAEIEVPEGLIILKLGLTYSNGMFCVT